LQSSHSLDGAKGDWVAVASIRVDAERSDYVFRDLESLHAFDPANGRMYGGLMGGSVTAAGDVYLGTFVLQVPEGARDTLYFDLQLGERTVLKDSFRRAMPLSVDGFGAWTPVE